MTSPKHQVEALLFSSGKAMTTEQLAELAKMDKAKVTRALKALQKDYTGRDSAVTIVNDGNTWKMNVTNEHLTLVRNIVADTELSRACMETLAVIAYKYPKVLQSEVIDTRGSGAYDHIKELDQLGFVRKEPSGRSYLIKLTEKFFEYFDIVGEKDIRKVFKNVKVPDKAEIQKQLGEMDVVDVEEKKELGMEVVDVSETPEKPDIPVEKKEEPEKKEEEKADDQHQNFLDDLDSKISSISQKNDENDADPLLQRPEPEEDHSETAVEDDAEESPKEDDPAEPSEEKKD